MIISRGYANKLVREGKAVLDGGTYNRNRERFQIVRWHSGRLDVYPLKAGQPTRITVNGKSSNEPWEEEYEHPDSPAK